MEPWALGPELFASTPNRTAEPRPRSERQRRFDAAATETRAHLENTLGVLHAQEHLALRLPEPQRRQLRACAGVQLEEERVI